MDLTSMACFRSAERFEASAPVTVNTCQMTPRPVTLDRTQRLWEEKTGMLKLFVTG